MNTNDYVWIRLTDVGRRMLRENYDRLFFGFPDLVKAHPFTLPTEVNGWTRMQLWHVANEFGRGMYNGADVPFETEFSLTDPASAQETPAEPPCPGCASAVPVAQVGDVVFHMHSTGGAKRCTSNRGEKHGL